MNDLQIVLAEPTKQLLTEINEYKLTQKQVSITYSLAMREPDSVDWPTVNTAIINRWSKAGLIRVKMMAWGMNDE